MEHFNKNFLFNHRFQLQRNVDCKNSTAGIGSKRSVKSPRRWHMNGDDLDYATAEKTTSHERALESLVRFKAKLKRFAQHLPLRGFSVHKFPIIARALVKKLNFITIKPSLLTPCFCWVMCEPRTTWFRKWKHFELALLSIVWEWWKCLAEFHFQTIALSISACSCHAATIVSDSIKSVSRST